ncbi:anti-sigma factor antagonist [Streptomyces sp. G44]|uniref:anti-sigma factor antagonist n=1 Tax=Streptomyces sp. G44 TaxID=2807632 RepID=UPI00195FC426|nr:anti-sigma factor antagonist [Streptomyces sp. G44]MBM7171214.1 anti-sigma factor antagonist [Streptomyces sp. G44]
MPEPAHPERPRTGRGAEHGHDGRTRVPLAQTSSPPASFETVPVGDDRVTLVLRGELDLEAGRQLRPGLTQVLGRAVRVVGLDLSRVVFCDCSGLNLLLALRQRALRHGKVLRVVSPSPAVDRIMDLTGTRHLFTPEGQEGGPAPAAAGDMDRDEESGQDLRTVVAQLRRAMQTRPTIDLARGILMSSFSLSPEAAWEVLVTASQNTNTKLHRLAGDLVGTAQGSTLPEGVHRQLVAAVSKTYSARAAPASNGATGDGAGPTVPARNPR